MQVIAEELPAFHKEDGLVFQFFLNEWLLASKCHFELSCQIDKLLEKPSSKRLTQDLESHIKKLSGIEHNFIRFVSPEHDGILKRLSHFAAILAQGISDEKAEERVIRKATNQAWGFAMALGGSNLKEQEEKILSELKKIGKAVPKLFLKFTKDENVLFFILRHKKDFDSLLGNGFVKKMIAKSYPKGHEEAESFLTLRYTKRGFTGLLPVIKTLMQDLKK